MGSVDGEKLDSVGTIQTVYRCQANLTSIDEWDTEKLIVEQKNDTEMGIIYEWKQSERNPPP